MSQSSPLTLVNDKFGGKDKLVDKLVGLLGSGDESKDDLRKRLLGVANKKLLRLHTMATIVKEKYGSREKLLEGTASALNRGKDKDYLTRLETYSSSRLVDMNQVANRRAKRQAGKAAAASAAPAAKKPARAKKPAAKKAG